MRSRSGATLVEVLVGAALLFGLLAVTVQVFVPALRAWTRAQVRSRVQQTVLSASRWIRTDLQEAAPETVGVQDGVLTAVLPGAPPEYDPSGLPLWTRQVVYWRSEDGKLHRQVADLPPDAEAQEAELPALDPNSRVVARDIASFEAESPRLGAVRFSLTAQRGEHRSTLTTTAASFHPNPPESTE